jgi:hypothetical protein
MPLENLKLSDEITLAALIAPISQGAGAVSSGWINAGSFNRLMAAIHAGVLGASATVDAKFQQATDSGGTGVKDVTGAAITQMVKATDDGKFSFINLDPQKLDVAGGFNFVRLTVTVGTAASLVSAEVWGANPRYGVASHASALKEAINVN